MPELLALQALPQPTLPKLGARVGCDEVLSAQDAAVCRELQVWNSKHFQSLCNVRQAYEIPRPAQASC